MYKTDLILETCEILKESTNHLGDFHGVLSEEYIDNTCKITKVTITNDQGATKIGKPIGEYFTLEIKDKKVDDIIFALKNILKNILSNNKKTLVAGIGNIDITPDALGPQVANNTVVTKHLLDIEYFTHLNDVSAISTNVLGKTGIETGVILKNICASDLPNSVIAIDALAAKNPHRLGNVIQVCNTGLTPGSGIGNSRLPINHETIGAQVIAIGVPTVITGQTLAYSISKTADLSEFSEIIVTPKDIDNIIKKLTKIISLAINYTLNPSLDADDIDMFLE